MKIIVFIGCIILVFITNYISYRIGLTRGMIYSLNKTYDAFMLAIYKKLKKDNKSVEEANKFTHDVHDLLINISDKIS